MFLLPLFGAGYGVLSDPTLLGALREVHITPRMPAFALGALTLDDFLLPTISRSPEGWPQMRRQEVALWREVLNPKAIELGNRRPFPPGYKAFPSLDQQTELPLP
jgi:hypothetical protein